MDSLGLGLSLALGLRFRVQQFRIWGLAFRHAIMTLIIAIPCAGVSLLAGVLLRSLDFLNGMMDADTLAKVLDLEAMSRIQGEMS